MPHTVILNDHITPYRLSLFRRLSALVDLTILYNTRRLPDVSLAIAEPLGFPHRVLPGKVIALKRPPFNDPRYIFLNPTLLFDLIRLNPRVVVGYAYSISCWTALLYARLFRKRFISWSNETLFTERYLSPMQRRIRAWIIPRADACITASQQGREKFLHYGASADRIFIVDQGTDTADLATRADALRESRQTYADLYNLTGTIILYVGSLTRRKGIAHLIDALPQIRAQIPDVRLLLAGEGDQRPVLETQAAALGLSDSIHFAGFIQPADLPALYASAHVFAFPSLEDSYASVITEAASCGLPIVTSCYAAASAELVIPDQNGYIVNPTTPDALSSALISILADEPRRLAMSAASRHIADQHSPQIAAASFHAAIRRAES